MTKVTEWYFYHTVKCEVSLTVSFAVTGHIHTSCERFVEDHRGSIDSKWNIPMDTFLIYFLHTPPDRLRQTVA